MALFVSPAEYDAWCIKEAIYVCTQIFFNAASCIVRNIERDIVCSVCFVCVYVCLCVCVREREQKHLAP
jgi:hypothetical protein